LRANIHQPRHLLVVRSATVRTGKSKGVSVPYVKGHTESAGVAQRSPRRRVYGAGGSSTGGWDMVESALPIALNAVQAKTGGIRGVTNEIKKLSTVVPTLYTCNYNSTMLLYIQVRGSTQY